MHSTVLLASNNAGKRERYKRLIASARIPVVLTTPQEERIEEVSVEEVGATTEENALEKARAYSGKTVLPILANDTAFWVEGEGFVLAPKRAALGGSTAHELSQEEIAEKMLAFWQGVAKKHGGSVNAAWIESFALVLPGGREQTARSRREVVLVDKVLGAVDSFLPVRALTVVRATGKPAVAQSQEEEDAELRPITEALRAVLAPVL